MVLLGLLSHQQVTDQMLLLMTEIINALPVGAAVEEEEQIGEFIYFCKYET